ncbi:MAG: 50S ribosomal protein L23 [Candidatus Azambacteria bacterium GW2011_GWA2_42_9]|uniref:Large ribosomal subunit protein uL23 n=3 Tax=Candidatus Azamiibacteriota TaxID=1752741 RepID=A0A0G0ZAY1_9BACT|nr:MAG: 50S ribosomal protein L23 [Candidatus Azambacteria bacterium GW2011_GWB1_42_17]KKS45857.1 MAG: 50S ribosomal protein L23 [Candidatus Azambacteria bacterium GW2011_GWA1_42_19]KKS75266.1 MAG: 50S ribosomal protein L23 [Candidatus Azambacteria bacterium GW2011_GWA2_42_9]KKS88325.1 MAG: 50S ribosomal protein L23 [Parcubacteria group bacterium GW2011_GWC1_43_11]
MPLLNKLFGKKSKPVAERVETPKKAEPAKKIFESDSVLLSPVTTEKALSGQKLNRYVFKAAPSANKIEIAKAISKNYNVKVVGVNIINVPKKSRRVGKNLGFKSGYKKAVVALAKGQSIELK